jgi:hypothetical protein
MIGEITIMRISISKHIEDTGKMLIENQDIIHLNPTNQRNIISIKSKPVIKKGQNLQNIKRRSTPQRRELNHQPNL